MPVEITHPVADASCANPRRSWIVTTAFHFVFKETDEVVFRLRGQYHFRNKSFQKLYQLFFKRFCSSNFIICAIEMILTVPNSGKIKTRFTNGQR